MCHWVEIDGIFALGWAQSATKLNLVACTTFCSHMTQNQDVSIGQLHCSAFIKNFNLDFILISHTQCQQCICMFSWLETVLFGQKPRTNLFASQAQFWSLCLVHRYNPNLWQTVLALSIQKGGKKSASSKAIQLSRIQTTDGIKSTYWKWDCRAEKNDFPVVCPM